MKYTLLRICLRALRRYCDILTVRAKERGIRCNISLHNDMRATLTTLLTCVTSVLLDRVLLTLICKSTPPLSKWTRVTIPDLVEVSAIRNSPDNLCVPIDRRPIVILNINHAIINKFIKSSSHNVRAEVLLKLLVGDTDNIGGRHLDWCDDL